MVPGIVLVAHELSGMVGIRTFVEVCADGRRRVVQGGRKVRLNGIEGLQLEGLLLLESAVLLRVLVHKRLAPKSCFVVLGGLHVEEPLLLHGSYLLFQVGHGRVRVVGHVLVRGCCFGIMLLERFLERRSCGSGA